MTQGSFISRLTAWSIMALLVIAAVFAVIVPFGAAHSGKSRAIKLAAERQARFAQEESKLTSLLELQQSGETSALSVDPLLEAATETAAAAKLQSLTDKAFRDQGMTLDRIRFPSMEAAGEAQRIGLAFSVGADLERIVRALHTLETRAPFIFVSNIELKPKGRSLAAAQADQTVPLRASITLYSYWQNAQPQQAPAT
ncbi:MAG: type II secretion system protein GspM [Pseudomonadota bacterium]